MLRFLAMILLLGHAGAMAADTKIKGMRLDPGYLYGPSYDGADAAGTVTDDAVAAGVNTIFVLAYSPEHGAYYPTDYPSTIVEGSLGVNDFLGKFLSAAHANGIKVVAWLPVNDFRKAWEDHSDWRSKEKSGADYLPRPDLHLMSAWHAGFRNWYEGLLGDITRRYPALDGIEAGEGIVDYRWDGGADFNAAGTEKFPLLYPGGVVGDSQWKKFRAEGLTGLHQILGRVAHSKGMAAFVVQTWTPHSDGTLLAASEIADGCGFDFEGVLNLPEESRPDFVVGEIMFQQWRDAFKDSTVFTPDWTRLAAQEFADRVSGRVTPIAHVELSDFGGGSLTDAELTSVLSSASVASGGVDFYDYHQAKTRRAFSLIRNALTP